MTDGEKPDVPFVDFEDAGWLAWATADWEKPFVPTEDNVRRFPA